MSKTSFRAAYVLARATQNDSGVYKLVQSIFLFILAGAIEDNL